MVILRSSPEVICVSSPGTMQSTFPPSRCRGAAIRHNFSMTQQTAQAARMRTVTHGQASVTTVYAYVLLS